jgi:hypothetical protein
VRAIDVFTQSDVPTYSAIQPNGERIRYERWVLEAWQRGTLTDPFLLRPLLAAVAIRPSDWPQVSK